VIIGNVANFGMIALVVMGVFDFRAGKISLPDILLLLTFAMTVLPRTVNLLFYMRDLTKRYDDLRRYFAILDEDITVKDAENPAKIEQVQGDIVFDNVSFHYGDDNQSVLNEFSLHIKAGESVAFVGYSGAGKTTIAKLLMRMYDPQQGEIRIDDVPVRSMRKSDLRELVGIVPQDPLLFDHTVAHNISYPRPNSSQKEIEEAASVAQIDSYISTLPKKYETIVGERGIKLSGGQRQRIALARVFLKQAPIVVLDEATSALDSASEKAIQDAFWQIAKSVERPVTSIIIAHRLSTVLRADRIIVLDKGRIAEQGTHDNLIKTGGIYARLWSMQRDGFLGDEE